MSAKASGNIELAKKYLRMAKVIIVTMMNIAATVVHFMSVEFVYI